MWDELIAREIARQRQLELLQVRAWDAHRDPPHARAPSGSSTTASFRRLLGAPARLLRAARAGTRPFSRARPSVASAAGQPAPALVVIWSFEVRPERAPEFERAYGPDGDWACLFARSGDYQGTEILHDHQRPGRYLTVDRWSSPEAYDAFHADHAAAYAALDGELGELTVRETPLGSYEVAPPTERPSSASRPRSSPANGSDLLLGIRM
ncbi:MAG: antibiotic biosynthesis monooxygenase [Gemmatimonadota bacterium]